MTSNQDVPGVHRKAEVDAILQAHEAGMTQEEIRRRLHISPNFIANVIQGKKRTCKYCGKDFYPNKSTSPFGKAACYFAWLRENTQM